MQVLKVYKVKPINKLAKKRDHLRIKPMLQTCDW